jgi:hypothetical protein
MAPDQLLTMQKFTFDRDDKVRVISIAITSSNRRRTLQSFGEKPHPRHLGEHE